MSTLGKVLVGLTTFFVLVWIFLMAVVADMNSNWGKKVKELEAAVEKTRSEIPAPLELIEKKKVEATLLQVEAERARASFRAEIAALQRSESEIKEARSRFELDEKAALAAEESSKARLAFRLGERRETQKLLEEAEAEVKSLMDENTELRNELKGLQDSFKQTVAENQTLLQKARKKGEPGATKVKASSVPR